jgi:hypothetical protein
MDIQFSEKIFLHNDEERRVTYDHIKSFYQKSKKEKLNNQDFIFFFGHALKGKDPEIYNNPVSRNLEDVKKEVFKKIDIKALGPNQGKKIKEIKKIVEDRYVDIFQRTHFGIVPTNEHRLQAECKERGIDRKKLVLNVGGMVVNACMSPNCQFYLQPLKGE